MMPLDEFYGLMKAVDAFDLVILEEGFQKAVKEKLLAHAALGKINGLEKLDKNFGATDAIQALVDGHKAEPMYLNGKLIGCVKKAHDFDAALSEHVMFENLVSKASAAFSLALLLHKTDLNPEDVEYIIECSEEACGDMNQRGGGKLRQVHRRGVRPYQRHGFRHTRSFCAARPTRWSKRRRWCRRASYQNVVVLAGGASAKLGLNAKDHVKKGLPVLEICWAVRGAHRRQRRRVARHPHGHRGPPTPSAAARPPRR